MNISDYDKLQAVAKSSATAKIVMLKDLNENIAEIRKNLVDSFSQIRKHIDDHERAFMNLIDMVIEQIGGHIQDTPNVQLAASMESARAPVYEARTPVYEHEQPRAREPKTSFLTQKLAGQAVATKEAAVKAEVDKWPTNPTAPISKSFGAKVETSN